MKHKWQTTLINAIQDPMELLQHLNISQYFEKLDPDVLQAFLCRVPEPFLHRIEKNNPHDPLLKQVLPINDELDVVPGFSTDPLQEHHHQPTQGLLHKYHGRVLLTLTGACAINCRYCFRRHFPYQEHTFNQTRWNAIVNHLKADDSIHEVILSGGDPLMLKDKKLQDIIGELETIAHIKTLRIHSRLPIVIPSRITQDFCNLLTRTHLNVVLVVHVNHTQEIDTVVADALKRLPPHITLLNQSVLLKGVNDNAQTLIDLSHCLFENGILPYYLHLLDPVIGTAHFDVPQKKAKQLVNEIRAQLPGYLVPRLARETAQEPAKTVIL